MKIAVRYYTKSGNTKKLAEAIAEGANVKAEDISIPVSEDVDFLFLGSSVYAMGADQQVKTFIENLQVKIGQVVNFSTAAIISSTYPQIKKLVDQKGYVMSEKEFHCKGSFGIMHKNRPNSEDLAQAKAFAKDLIK